MDETELRVRPRISCNCVGTSVTVRITDEKGDLITDYSSLTAPNLQHTANQERNDQCGNQHQSREVLMMGIVVPETC